jgi:hypothetical protein
MLFKNSVRTSKRTLHHHYNDQFVNAVQGNNHVYTDNLTEPIHTKRRVSDC